MNVDCTLEATGTAVTIVDVSPSQNNNYILITYVDASNDIWVREVAFASPTKIANTETLIDDA